MQIVRSRELCRRLAVSRMTVWRWSQSGEFPAPLRLGPRLIGWDYSDVENWIESRKNGPRTRPGAANGADVPE